MCSGAYTFRETELAGAQAFTHDPRGMDLALPNSMTVATKTRQMPGPTAAVWSVLLVAWLDPVVAAAQRNHTRATQVLSIDRSTRDERGLRVDRSHSIAVSSHAEGVQMLARRLTRPSVALTLALACLGCGDDSGTGTGDVAGGGSGGTTGAGSGAGTGAKGTAGLTAVFEGDTSGAGGGAAGMGALGGMGDMGDMMAPPTDRDGAAFAMVAPAFAEAYCGVLQRCLPPAISNLVFAGTDCEASILASLEDGELVEVQTSIDAGRALYDATKVDPCFELLDSLDCTMQAAQLLEQGACGEIVRGTVAEGGDCGNSSECIGDTYCDRTAGCPGVCTKQRDLGDGCTADDECAEPASCSDETGHCAVPGAADDPCGGGLAPGCGLGFMCTGDDADTMQAGTCKPIEEVFAGEDGDTCDFDTSQLCADGLPVRMRASPARRPAAASWMLAGLPAAVTVPAPRAARVTSSVWKTV